MNKEKITAGTIIRALCLILALVNLTLETMGKKIIPITDDQISELVTLVITIATSLVGFWKNNSFTQEAIIADGIMHELKAIANKDYDDAAPKEVPETQDGD